MNILSGFLPRFSIITSRWSVVFILITISQVAFAQEQLGLRVEKYGGINSILLNPANMAHSPFRWDFNLVEAGAFFENSYAHFRDVNTGGALRGMESAEVAADYDNESQIPANALILDFNESTYKKFVFANGSIMGPSFAFRLDSGHSFGFVARLRTVISSRGIPHEMSYRKFDDTRFLENIYIDPFQVAGMAWNEFGVNYAYSMETAGGYLNIGGTFKLLRGYEGFYWKLNEMTDVIQIPGDTLNLTGVSFDYGFTDSNAGGDDFETSIAGKGLGIDLGINYVIDKEVGLTRLGAGLIDIGRIKFDGAQNHQINTGLSADFIPEDYNGDDLVAMTEVLSHQLLGDSLASVNGNTFPIWLPAGLTLQGDYYFTEYLGANVTVVKGLPLGEFAVKRGDMLALTPHFSHRWFSASLPVVLYNWRRLNFGLSMRLAFLSFGTDNLGSFFGKRQFTGSDFYIGLKINPFQLNRGSGGGGSQRGKGVKCYEF